MCKIAITLKCIFPDGREKIVVKDPHPLEYCFGVSEDYARRHLKFAFADAKAVWLNNEASATQGQQVFLEKETSWTDSMSKLKASLAIRTIITKKNKQRQQMNSEPITDPQRNFLDRKGMETNNLSKLGAQRLIAQIKQDKYYAYVPYRRNFHDKKNDPPEIINRLAEIAMCSDSDTAEMLIDKTVKASIEFKKKNYSFIDDGEDVSMSEKDIRHANVMIQGCQPTNMVEALLATQFAALHLRGMTLLADKHHHKYGMAMLRLSQTTLETILKLRYKGIQNVNVNYNYLHNEGSAVIGITGGGGHV